MKTKKLFMLILLAFVVLACKKTDETEVIEDITHYDHSLILSRGSGAKLVLTNPVDGKDLYVSKPAPAVEDVKGLKAGYMCRNAVFIAKNKLKKYTMSIYTCDAKTGLNNTKVTEDNLYVYPEISISPTEPKIVFSGKPNDIPQYRSIYSINEDGSGLSHLSEPLELISGPNGGTFQIQPASFPAFSPDGSKIAFHALVVSHPQANTFNEFVIIMNSDGSNKEVVFSDPGKNTGIYDLCWSKDGQFLLFMLMRPDDGFHRWVKALNINSRKMSDITSILEVNGDQVYHISTSPNSNKIVFNQHLGGGSDLFIADFEYFDDVFSIKGSPVKLTNRDNTGYSYYTPSWQVWDENTTK